MRKYISAILSEACKKTGFTHQDLDKPLIKFEGDQSIGARIYYYRANLERGGYYYDLGINLGIGRAETSEAIAEISAYLDYLVMHEFGHPLIGDGYVSPDFRKGQNLDKNGYEIKIPSAPTLSVDFTEDYEYGLGECAIDKFAFEAGGERTKEAYIKYSERLLAEEDIVITPRLFYLFINHIAVLQELGKAELARKFSDKVSRNFSNQTYFEKFGEILKSYKIYYRNSSIQLKEKE